VRPLPGPVLIPQFPKTLFARRSASKIRSDFG
jgi:hypothetical protein